MKTDLSLNRTYLCIVSTEALSFRGKKFEHRNFTYGTLRQDAQKKMKKKKNSLKFFENINMKISRIRIVDIVQLSETH